jgi:hypothetical protein
MIDPFRTVEQEREIERVEVSGVPVDLIWTSDEFHEYGGNYTYGWKLTLNGNQYGDFLGHIDEHAQQPEAKAVLLEQCAKTIEALRAK